MTTMTQKRALHASALDGDDDAITAMVKYGLSGWLVGGVIQVTSQYTLNIEPKGGGVGSSGSSV